MKIKTKNEIIDVNINEVADQFEKFNTTYIDSHQKITSGEYKGIKLSIIFKKYIGYMPLIFNVYAKDGYKMIIERNETSGQFYLTTEKDGKPTKLTFIVKGNDDGKLRVVNVERIEEVFTGNTNKEKIELNYSELSFDRLKIGNRKYTGVDIGALIDKYKIDGDIISFASDDGYNISFEREPYLISAIIEKEKRTLMGLNLKLGNWVKYINKISGKSREIIFKL